MAVEQVYIVYLHAFQTLVERCHEILSAAPVAIRAGPHVVACLRRDEELVAIGAEVLVHQSSHGLLCRAVYWAVVVGQVEVRDAMVEGIVGYLTAAFVGVYASEVMPEAEAHLRQ